MTGVLGRVAKSDLAVPRGPDAIHRIRVPREWLERGATVEFELPRHLSCAACDGGGCDACHRSGAVTLRGRNEPSDLVEVSLPAGARDDAFVIRIPERGGFAPDASLPRGLLLLRVEPCADEAGASVTVRGRGVSLVDIPIVHALRSSLRAPLSWGFRERALAVAVALAILGGVLLLFWR
jgi:hypothetical protein